MDWLRVDEEEGEIGLVVDGWWEGSRGERAWCSGILCLPGYMVLMSSYFTIYDVLMQ